MASQKDLRSQPQANVACVACRRWHSKCKPHRKGQCQACFVRGKKCIVSEGVLRRKRSEEPAGSRTKSASTSRPPPLSPEGVDESALDEIIAEHNQDTDLTAARGADSLSPSSARRGKKGEPPDLTRTSSSNFHENSISPGARNPVRLGRCRADPKPQAAHRNALRRQRRARNKAAQETNDVPTPRVNAGTILAESNVLSIPARPALSGRSISSQKPSDLLTPSREMPHKAEPLEERTMRMRLEVHLDGRLGWKKLPITLGDDFRDSILATWRLTMDSTAKVEVTYGWLPDSDTSRTTVLEASDLPQVRDQIIEDASQTRQEEDGAERVVRFKLFKR